MFGSKTGQDVSLVKYGHSHGELHRAIKGRGEASSAPGPEEKALASEPAPVAPRIPSSSSVAFFLTTENQTSAGNCGPRRGTELFSGAAFNFPHRAERPAGLRLQRLGRDEEDERTFGLHGEMDEFRRLKVMYPTVPNCLPSRICRIPGFCQGGVSASGSWAWQRGPW